MTALSLLLSILPILKVDGGVSMDYRRNNQHVTIDRDGSQIDVRFGDILEINGRKMTYIGNEQWMGQDSAGQWDSGSIQQMPASYFLTVTHFHKTGDRITPSEIGNLAKTIRGWGDAYKAGPEGEGEGKGGDDADSGEDDIDAPNGPNGHFIDHFGASRILYFVGRAIQIFLSLYFVLIAAAASFVISLLIGYTAFDWWIGNCQKKGFVQFVDSDDEERVGFVPAAKEDAMP